MAVNYGLTGGTLPDPPEPDADAQIRYDVKITGNEAPFKWEVQRWMPGAMGPGLPTADCRGESDTYEEAMFDAAAAARGAEQKRQHDSATRIEHLFYAPLAVGSHLGLAEGPMELQPQ